MSLMIMNADNMSASQTGNQDDDQVETQRVEVDRFLTPNGDKMTLYIDGSVSKEKPDGSKITVNIDKSSSAEFSDGNKIIKNTDGSTSVELSDGNKITLNLGSLVVKFIDGRKLIENTDGSCLVEYSDGKVTTDPDRVTLGEAIEIGKESCKILERIFEL